MITIYADESGDMGFKSENSSKVFVFAFIFCEPDIINDFKYDLEKLREEYADQGKWPRNLQEMKFNINVKRLLKKTRINKEAVIKAKNSLPETRVSVLSLLSKFSSDIRVCAAILNKQQLPSTKRNHANELYKKSLIEPLKRYFIPAYTDTKILRPERRPFENRFKIILDKSMNPAAEEAFSAYVSKQAVNHPALSNDTPITFSQAKSEEDPLIWVADHVAGAIHSSYEHQEDQYYNIFRNLISRDDVKFINPLL